MPGNKTETASTEQLTQQEFKEFDRVVREALKDAGQDALQLPAEKMKEALTIAFEAVNAMERQQQGVDKKTQDQNIAQEIVKKLLEGNAQERAGLRIVLQDNKMAQAIEAGVKAVVKMRYQKGQGGHGRGI